MVLHQFIFEPGCWLGEGKIAFSASHETIRFYTRWECTKHAKTDTEKELITTLQKVEMHGDNDQVENNLTFSLTSAHEFKVILENQLIGKIDGTGFCDDKKIAWEFRNHPNFEGFEVYDLQDNGDYIFHAEYVSPDQFRSIINGRIWKKMANSEK